MDNELRKKAFAALKPPFRIDTRSAKVLDANGEYVLEAFVYAGVDSDTMDELIAEALTKLWEAEAVAAQHIGQPHEYKYGDSGCAVCGEGAVHYDHVDWERLHGDVKELGIQVFECDGCTLEFEEGDIESCILCERDLCFPCLAEHTACPDGQ